MNNKNIIKIIKKDKGFTLIELLIAMAITGIISAAIFTAFQSQQNSYLIQEDTAVMQQNLRAGMDMMVREIRMAGYDPTGNADAQIKRAEPDLIYFTRDDNGDGNLTLDADDDGEHIAFDLYDSNGIETLGRTASKNVIAITGNPPGSGHFEATGHQPLAENIEGLSFAYAFDADGDGKLDTYDALGLASDNIDNDGDGDIDEQDEGKVIWAVDSDGDNDLDTDVDDQALVDFRGNPIPDVAVADIRAVRIWMLVRAERGDQKFSHNNIYTPKTYPAGSQTWGPYNDNFRRRFLTTTVKCRNLGL